MYDYDTFEIGNASLDSTAAPLGYNNSSTALTVPKNYRMKLRNVQITNLGTGSATALIEKVSPSGSAIIIANPAIAAGSTWPSNGESPEYIIESGYYLQASISTSGAIFATGEFIPE